MHKFVKTTFSLPTTCGYCAESIWGLSSKGAKCEDCSYSCHLKCEIKVPADCTGPPDQPKGNFITRAFRGKKSKKDSMSSINKSTNDLSSSTDNFETLKNSNRGSDENISLKSEANSNTEIFSRPLSTQVENKSQFDDEVSAFSYAVNSGRSNEIIEKTRDVSAVVLYDYISQQGNDLTISKGDVLQIISEDDGSGWLKARASNGRVGVVPANYVDINAEDNPTHERFFTALYDFTGRNDNEISFEKGDRIQFTGECADDSWFYGILRGQAGIFPKSYVE
ncbi:Protein BZZ1 [Zancudomyces culisetae]|nr:Protein BZZ1 [Zancudomyces culisetae]|eukprot:OMH81246.1 Protein BZZ1 [Zancudomyces culisetae]